MMEPWWNMPFFPEFDLSSSSTDLVNNHGKKHAACDECRSRKLKCTSEATGCARCRRDEIPCHYSSQKPMGRPRRKKEDPHREPSPPRLNAFYSGNNNDNGAALPLNNSKDLAASAQEKPQGQTYITTDIPTSAARPSDGTSTSTNTTTSHYEPPSRDSPCVYGDPAMLISNIRYNLVPLDILLPKQRHLT